MRLAFAENIRRLSPGPWNLPFDLVLLFAVCLAACNNTCFSFTSNPPKGTINIKAGDPKPSCTLTHATAAVRLVVQEAPLCSSCSESTRIQHVFVSIQGIDVHESSKAEDDSPGWRQLAPQLAAQPVQVDLVGGTGHQGTREPWGETAAIPAGIYRQVRVRFASEVPAADDRLTGENACGEAGFNCAVMADGTVQSLHFDTASPELRMTSERIEGGFLLVFPNRSSALVIEMKPVWLLASSVKGDVRLLPALTGEAKIERGEYP